MTKIEQAYALAKEQYAALGVDTDAAIAAADRVPLSIHCWQGDDVIGFEDFGGNLTGGIQTTGNYPGRARTPAELRADMDKALSYIPGEKKVNIHACYVESDTPVDRNEIEPCHFANWANWAAEKGIGLDFNGTFFSHPKSEKATLSSADEEIRSFWVEHGKRVREISAYFAEKTGKPCVNNLWIPDGDKEFPVDTYGPRLRLKKSLDEIQEKPFDREKVVDCVESKVFGIGSESYVVGSHEFYMGYALSRDDVLVTFDTGHFHPTEMVSNKLSAILLYKEKVLLHVSRPVRWDSDHVVTFDDELRAIMNELVRMDALDRVYLALDYFDASINRVVAWGVGARNTRKAILNALLQPVDYLKKMEAEGDTSGRLAVAEELKSMPFGAVWDYYCAKAGVPVGLDWLEDARAYERDVLSKR
ncbi:MAG: L-rhamnose isomerase [Ruminococcaceae bacterium]|nr:L-rhamnose isomerase [Oscillospiraceae bacterium]